MVDHGTNDRVELAKAIRAKYGGSALHVSSIRVTETVQGSTVWDGAVEVYLITHAEARTAYAWTHHTGDVDNPTKHLIVLHLPPIDSAKAAVLSVLMHEIRAHDASPS
jgi:hypothetical protein